MFSPMIIMESKFGNLIIQTDIQLFRDRSMIMELFMLAADMIARRFMLFVRWAG